MDPIGNGTTKFFGSYDGQGFTISELTINRPGIANIGMFGYAQFAKLSNIHLTNVNITGGTGTGGLTGYFYGSQNSTPNGVITNCSTTGSVISSSNYVGGLVGQVTSYSVIQQCSSTCTVVGAANFGGGLVGYCNTSSTIYNSYAGGTVTIPTFSGGLIGIMASSSVVTNCYSYTAVSGTTNKGGFIGRHGSGTISGSFWDTEVSGLANAAGFGSPGGITGLTTTAMKTESNYFAAGWDFVGETVNGTNDYWAMSAGNNNGYPNLAGIFDATWTGNTDSDWNTAGNWSPATIPTAYANITIPAEPLRQPVINQAPASPAVCNTLTIQDGASLTIAAGNSLTVSGSIANATVNSGLVIESNASGTGSLIATNGTTGSGTALIERYMPELVWHIVSSPAGGQTVTDFIGDNTGIPYIPASGLLPDRYGMMDYDPALDKWNDYFTDATAITEGSLGIGKGYMVRVMNVVNNLRFKGVINPTFTVSVSTGWNCIGNPFTSAIRINTAAGSDNFMTVNTGLFDDNNKALYFWNQTKSGGAGYDVVNLADDGATYAQVGQGFFMKAKAAGDASFTTAMQTHQTAAPFKAATVPYPRIRIIAAANNKTVSTDIKFIKGTQKGLDPGYDAGLFTTDKSFSIYTKLVEDNGVQFQLQCLPPTGYDKMVIPIGIESKAAGEIVFTVETVQLAPDCKVILEDKLTHTFTDLSKNSYKASVLANTSASDRFFLHTGDIISGVEDQVLQGKLTAYANGNTEIRIIGEVGDGAVATLFNGLGQVVLTKKLGAGRLNIIGLPNLSSGLYLLNIDNFGTPQTIKVMVRK